MATQFNDNTRTGIEGGGKASQRFVDLLTSGDPSEVHSFHVGTVRELRERLKDIPLREGEKDEE